MNLARRYGYQSTARRIGWRGLPLIDKDVTPSYLSAGFSLLKPQKEPYSPMQRRFGGYRRPRLWLSPIAGRRDAFRTGLIVELARSVMTTSMLPQDFEKDCA